MSIVSWLYTFEAGVTDPAAVKQLTDLSIPAQDMLAGGGELIHVLEHALNHTVSHILKGAHPEHSTLAKPLEELIRSKTKQKEDQKLHDGHRVLRLSEAITIVEEEATTFKEITTLAGNLAPVQSGDVKIDPNTGTSYNAADQTVADKIIRRLREKVLQQNNVRKREERSPRLRVGKLHS